MSVLINQFYANPATPIWGGGSASLPCVIAVDGGTPTAYTIEAESVVNILSLDTSGFVDGCSYLVMIGFQASVSAGFPLAPEPILFGLSYTDEDGVWSSGTQLYYDNTITQTQNPVLGISLPLVYNGGSNVVFFISNVDVANIEITLELLTQAVIETGTAPTQAQIFVPK
jgi:hypothetical protein